MLQLRILPTWGPHHVRSLQENKLLSLRTCRVLSSARGKRHSRSRSTLAPRNKLRRGIYDRTDRLLREGPRQGGSYPWRQSPRRRPRPNWPDTNTITQENGRGKNNRRRHSSPSTRNGAEAGGRRVNRSVLKRCP